MQGYETVGFDAVSVPPPDEIYEYEKKDLEEEALTTTSLLLAEAAEAHLSPEEARASLVEAVRAQCCYGVGAAHDMVITSMVGYSNLRKQSKCN